MRKLKIRTKIESGIIISILIILIVSFSGSSLTRIISDDSDNVVTFIRNSKGNLWEATGSNIQKAIWDLNSTNGGTVWLPSGEMINNLGRGIEPIDNLNLIGTGKTVIKASENLNYPVIDFGYNTIVDGHHDVLIEKIEIDGNNESQNSPNQYCSCIMLRGEDTYNVTIRDCELHHSYAAPISMNQDVTDSKQMHNITVDNCYVHSREYDLGPYHGGITTQARNVIIKNCFIKDTYACGITFEGAGEDWPCYDCIAENNIITGYIAHGIHCESGKSHNITIRGNIIHHLRSNAYDVGATHFNSLGLDAGEHNIVTGNRIHHVAIGVRCDNGAIIVDNYIYDINWSYVTPCLDGGGTDRAGNGIYAYGCDGSIISNNIIEKCAANGIYRFDSNTQILGNHLKKINGSGMTATQGTSSTIINNNYIEARGSYGLYIYRVTDFTVTGNYIEGTNVGIYCRGPTPETCDYNIITNNNLRQCTTGMDTNQNANSVINDNLT